MITAEVRHRQEIVNKSISVRSETSSSRRPRPDAASIQLSLEKLAANEPNGTGKDAPHTPHSSHKSSPSRAGEDSSSSKSSSHESIRSSKGDDPVKNKLDRKPKSTRKPKGSSSQPTERSDRLRATSPDHSDRDHHVSKTHRDGSPGSSRSNHSSRIERESREIEGGRRVHRSKTHSDVPPMNHPSLTHKSGRTSSEGPPSKSVVPALNKVKDGAVPGSTTGGSPRRFHRTATVFDEVPTPPIMGDEDGKQVIKWISPSTLISTLVDTTVDLDTSFLSVFLYSYPYFSTGLVLLDKLIWFFDNATPEEALPKRQRITSILAFWLQPLYSWQIVVDKTLYRSLEKVISGKLAHIDKSNADLLLTSLQKLSETARATSVALHASKSVSTLRSIEKANSGGVSGKRKTRAQSMSFGGGSKEKLVLTPPPKPLPVPETEKPNHTIDIISSNTFTIHFSADSKKSFLLNSRVQGQSLQEVLEPICAQRDILLEDYVPTDLNGKTVPLDTKLGDIPAAEIEIIKKEPILASSDPGASLTIMLPGHPNGIMIAISDERFMTTIQNISQTHQLGSCEELKIETKDNLDIKYDANTTVSEVAKQSPTIYLLPSVARKTISSDRKKSFSPFGKEAVKKRKAFDILSLPPEVMAVGFHMIEFQLFCDITPQELFHAAWKKEKKDLLAPNVCAMVNWFNKITNWLQTQIVLGSSPKERAHIIERCIGSANICFKQHNFNSMFEIISALNGLPVRRLKASWREVSEEAMALWTPLQKIFSPETNFIELRTLMTPILNFDGFPRPLPYIGICLQDMMQLEETPSRDDRGLVNWNKMRKMAANFHYIRTLQSKQTEVTMKPLLKSFVDFCNSDSMVSLSEKEQMSLSKQVEPPTSRKTNHPISKAETS